MFRGRDIIEYKEGTKKAQELIERASKQEATYLHQVYGRCSEAKRKAFDELWHTCYEELGGYGFGICSHNVNGFTVSFVKDTTIYLVTKDYVYMTKIARF